jgi:hypothetical protein
MSTVLFGLREAVLGQTWHGQDTEEVEPLMPRFSSIFSLSWLG